MPPKSKFTEADEKKVWDYFSQGLIFKQVAAEMKLTTGAVYRLLTKAVAKWGTPKPE